MNEEILAKVQDAIQESLGAPRESITLKAKLIEDLESDSLDLLDILFALEEKFGIKLKRGQIEAEARAGIPDGEFEVDGMLTAQGAERLKKVLPEVDHSGIKENMPLSAIPALFTVETFYRLVENQLARKEDS